MSIKLWLRAATVLMALLVAPLNSGCNSSPLNSEPALIHVQVWSMWTGDEQTAFEQVLASYNRTHPGIVVENLSGVDDPKTVRGIVAGDPPDLCTLSVPSYLGTLAANDALIPLDDRFAGSGLKAAEYTPGSLEQCRYRGHLYALPYLLDCTALMYNKDVFKSAGLDPDKPPKTLEEMEADAKQITKRDANGKLIRVGFRGTDANSLIAAFGGQFYDEPSGRIEMDTPTNVRALTYYKQLMDVQGGNEAVQAFAQGFASSTSNYNPFFQGQVGMVFDGEWNPYWAAKYSPNAHYGVAPLPYPAADPSLAGTVWLGSNPLCIPRGAKHAKEAWDFLVWTQTPEAQAMFAAKMNNVPNIRTVLKDPQLRDGAPWKAQFGKFLDLSDSPNARFFPPMPVATMYSNQIANALDSICYGRKTPEEALSDAQRRTQREMDKYPT